MGKNRYYDTEFKREAVRFVYEDGRTVSDVAKSLGISTETLRNWLRLHRQQGSAALCDQANKSTDHFRSRDKEQKTCCGSDNPL